MGKKDDDEQIDLVSQTLGWIGEQHRKEGRLNEAGDCYATLLCMLLLRDIRDSLHELMEKRGG